MPFFFDIFNLINRLKYNFQYLSQFNVFHVALDITAKSLMNQTQISAIFTLCYFPKSARFIFKESYFS